MKKTIVSTNWLNKVIAAAMMMAITTAMPAMAGNRNHKSHDKKTTVIVVTNSPRGSHFDRVDKRTSHFDNHRHHAYRPVVKTCTFRVSRHMTICSTPSEKATYRLMPWVDSCG